MLVLGFALTCLDTRFWFRYEVGDEAAKLSQWFYFKLYLNGRAIVSWGMNTKAKRTGEIMKALFEPGEEWNYEYNSIAYKNMGNEQRSFMFLEQNEKYRPARDGGLIKVEVFRAKGRSRKMPQPTDYKGQEEYGIGYASPVPLGHACFISSQANTSQECRVWAYKIILRTPDTTTGDSWTRRIGHMLSSTFIIAAGKAWSLFN
jgi:hypothetical protein